MAGRTSKTRLIIMAILIITVAAIVVIALNCSSCNPSDSTPQSDEAPDFTLPTMTGANITLSELEGTPVVLNFWSISCSWCRKQLPYLENAALQNGVEIKVIAVNIADNAASVQTFFGDYEPTMIIALDSTRETFRDYSQKYDNPRGSIPFTLFVDSEGTVKDVHVGAFASEEQLQEALNSVFEL